MSNDISDKDILLIKLLIHNKGSVINNVSEDQNAISVAYEFLDLKFYHCLLNSSYDLDIFSNLTTKKLIYTMICKNDWINLKLLIEKSVLCEREDVFIMNLANKLLKEKQIDLSKLVISKCTNRNIHFKNGETLLTFAIKENYEESLIMNLIELFEYNHRNEKNETPLHLATEKSLLKLVDLISKLNKGRTCNGAKSKVSSDIQVDESKTTQRNWQSIQTNGNVDNDYQIESFFTTAVIPENKKVFKEIGINKTVKYYMDTKNGVIDLFGKVVWTGFDKHGVYYYGLELEKEREDATDGVFERQKLFQCKPHCGVLAVIYKVGLDSRIKEKESENLELITSEISSTVELSVSSNFYEGLNFGIQGNISTSFFDSILYALFSKSDVLDFIIAQKLNDVEINETTVKFRSVLAFKVIYPLRKYGFVSFEKIDEIKCIFKEYGQRYEDFVKEETNIDNSLAYLSKLWPCEQLLSLISYNNYKSNSMYVQLFGRFIEFMNHVTSQEMLDMSMVNNEIMFNTLPSCLIMNIPMDNRQEFGAIDLIPLKTIDISQVSIVYFKKCQFCTKKAIRQCRKCIEKSKFYIRKGFYCDIHKCEHEEMQILPFLPLESKSKSKLFLKSIICFDKYKYVAFVKQDDFTNKWLRFDNMSSEDKNVNYSAPKVSFSEDVTNFFNRSDKEILNNSENYYCADVRLILRQANALIYVNSSMTCY